MVTVKPAQNRLLEQVLHIEKKLKIIYLQAWNI